MKWAGSFLIIFGMLLVVGCENRGELDAAQERIEELELRGKQLSGDLEGVRQQLKEAEEASRLADEESLEKKKLMGEIRERLAALQVKNAEVVRMKKAEIWWDQFYAQLKKDEKEYEERLNKAINNSPRVRAHVGDRRLRKIGDLKGILNGLEDEIALIDAQLKEIARQEAKLEE